VNNLPLGARKRQIQFSKILFFLVAKKKRVKKGKSKKVTEGGTEPESVANTKLYKGYAVGLFVNNS
jgi:hypothetical protein